MQIFFKSDPMRYLLVLLIVAATVGLLPSYGNLTAQSASPVRENGKCRIIGKGLEYCLLNLSLPHINEGRAHVVRIDPARAKLKLLLASEHGGQSRTPFGWCREFGLAAAINAGMYGQDYLTNVGYLKNGNNIQNKRWVKSYRSALAFESSRSQSAPAVIIDLDDHDAMKQLQDYRVVIQNLRLLKGNGVNVWKKTEKKWSEAAIGIDTAGRILFIFCGLPYSMWEFNELIKSSGLGVVRMMHVEGGAVAGMSVRTGGFSLDLAGVSELGGKKDGISRRQWTIPNVIGVQIR